MNVIRYFPIKQVVVYAGHSTHPLFGPYRENIGKRTEMFKKLNPYREAMGRSAWQVHQIHGERLKDALMNDPRHTLLVIPAGQSTTLDKVFSQEELYFLKDSLAHQGLRAYLNCGSAYWASETRIYDDVCSEQPTQKNRIVKQSRIPLFRGTSIGPLCPHPSPVYKVGFFSDAIEVRSGEHSCTVLLSGGGSFLVSPSDPNVTVLATYPHSELQRLGKPRDHWATHDIATILVRVQKGAALLSMFHPYYSAQDFDPERYEQAFPGSGTNWRRIVEKLTPEKERMRFVLERFLLPLEDLI